MMKATKIHTYKGTLIYPAECADKLSQGLRWYIQKYHPTGIPYDSQLCPHYYTLEAAKLAVNERLQQDKMEAP
jgi:hypothetical protein